MYAASIRCPFLALALSVSGMRDDTRVCFTLRGDPARAFSYNPRFILVPIMYVYFILDGHIFGKRADTAVIALCAAYLAVTYALIFSRSFARNAAGTADLTFWIFDFGGKINVLQKLRNVLDDQAAFCVKCGVAKGMGNNYCQNCGRAVKMRVPLPARCAERRALLP